jgi:hypothetical protein
MLHQRDVNILMNPVGDMFMSSPMVRSERAVIFQRQSPVALMQSCLARRWRAPRKRQAEVGIGDLRRTMLNYHAVLEYM